MFRTELKAMLCVLTLALAMPLSGAEGGKGGAGGGGGGGGGGAGGAGGDGAVIFPPKVTPEQLKAAEANMTAEQRKWFDQYVELSSLGAMKAQGRSFEDVKKAAATQGYDVKTEAEFLSLARKEHLTWIAAETPEEQKRFFNDLPKQVVQLHKRLDPTFLTDEEKAAAAKLPASVAGEIDSLLSDDIDTYLKARETALKRGSVMISLLAERLKSLPADSSKRVRVESAMKILAAQHDEEREHLLRASEAGFKRVDELRKSRPANAPKLAVLVSRRLTSITGRNETPVYDQLCYFSFPNGSHGYEGKVSLMFDNGGKDDMMSTRMYNGQGNALEDMGAVDFASVKSAPNADVTSQWKDSAHAAAGHVYMEHCLESRDNLDATFKFKVVEVKTNEWIIIEWAEIPQDK